MKEQTPKIIDEFIASPDDKVWKAVRPFFLEVRLGPLVLIEKNSLARLTEKTARDLFAASKIEPLHIGKTFQAIRSFRTPGPTGEWLVVEPNDIVKIENPDEALQLLRAGTVREKGEQNESQGA